MGRTGDHAVSCSKMGPQQVAPKGGFQQGQTPTKTATVTDLQEPSRPADPYWLWLGENRAALEKEAGTRKGPIVGKLAGERWKSMSASAKAPFEKKAGELRADDDKAMEEFTAAGGQKGKRMRDAKTTHDEEGNKKAEALADAKKAPYEQKAAASKAELAKAMDEWKKTAGTVGGDDGGEALFAGSSGLDRDTTAPSVARGSVNPETGAFSIRSDVDHQEKLDIVKEKLYAEKFVHLDAESMKEFLKGYGAQTEDFEKLQLVFDDPSKTVDPGNGLKYVDSRVHLFKKSSDEEPTSKVWNTRKFGPHQTIVIQDETFVVGNNGLTFRPYGKAPDWACVNPALESMLKLTLEMMHPETQAPRDGQIQIDDEIKTTRDIVIETAFQQVEHDPSALTGIKNGNASPEGIHQDDDDVVLIVFMGRHNVKAGGESRVYDLKVESGPFGDDMLEERNSHLKTPAFTMTRPFEGILLLDMEVKHEARGTLKPIMPEKRAFRNIITLHARRPHADGADDSMLQQSKLVPRDSDGFTEEQRIEWLSKTFAESDKFFALEQKIWHKHKQMCLEKIGNKEDRVKRINELCEKSKKGELSGVEEYQKLLEEDGAALATESGSPGSPSSQHLHSP